MYSELFRSDTYFKPIHELINPVPDEYGIVYTDLFYVRVTRQIRLNLFLKEKRGINFLQEQLQITEDYINTIKPELAIVFNRSSKGFWSGQSPGMNFKMAPQRVNIENLNMADNSKIKFPILFSRYLKYINQSEKEAIKKTIQHIFERLQN